MFSNSTCQILAEKRLRSTDWSMSRLSWLSVCRCGLSTLVGFGWVGDKFRQGNPGWWKRRGILTWSLAPSLPFPNGIQRWSSLTLEFGILVATAGCIWMGVNGLSCKLKPLVVCGGFVCDSAYLRNPDTERRRITWGLGWEQAKNWGATNEPLVGR